MTVMVGVTFGRLVWASVVVVVPPVEPGVVAVPAENVAPDRRDADELPMSSTPNGARPRQSGSVSVLPAAKSAAALAPRPLETGAKPSDRRSQI